MMSDTDEDRAKAIEAEKAAAAAAEEDAGDGDDDKDYKKEAEKWKAMSRKHEADAKKNAVAAKQLAEIEESKKSEIEKLTDAGKAADQRATAAEAKALRYEIAAEKSVPKKLLKFLAGGTREEIEASADELLEAIKPDTGEEDTGNGKPKERLRGGGSSSDTDIEEDDPAKLAALVPRT